MAVSTNATAGSSKIKISGEVGRTSFGGQSGNPLNLQLKLKNTRNILMELRKICQHPYLTAPLLEDELLPTAEQQKRLISASGKLLFLKQLLPSLKERGHRVLLFSQFKIALDRIEDFLNGEGIKFLRLDGDVAQAARQKSMDAYNAPGSEYFIFLLTTRAGGVGINLATADTVIIYDPDFNPHQDLQAIARAHRFGQQNPVLVFKLMMKDTVEEQIVFKGKKKMVLDHLVVQNLNTADEEVDIDSIIMHGAKALYEKTDQAGNERGIIWNSKNVNDLIDEAEREVNKEWDAFKMRWKLEDEMKERGEKPETNKEARAFGFAKIWEVDQAGMVEIEEVEEDKELEEDEGGLAALSRHAIVDPTEEGVGREGTRVRQIPAQQLRQQQYEKELEEALAMGDTPVKKKAGKQGKKGKGKEKEIEVQDDKYDQDFALLADDSSDSDYNGTSGGEEALSGISGKPVGTKGMVQRQHGPGGAAAGAGVMKVAKALAKAQRLSGVGVNNGDIPPTSSSNTSPRKHKQPSHRLTEEEKRLRKEARQAEKRRMNEIAVPEYQGPNGDGFGIGGGLDDDPYAHLMWPLEGAPPLSSPSTSFLNPINTTTATTGNPPSPDHRSKLSTLALNKDGQHVLQWLYHVLREFVFPEELKMWAKIGLVELPTAEREGYYNLLSKKADARLSALNFESYFLIPSSKSAVFRLIRSKRSILPSGPAKAIIGPLLPYPKGIKKGRLGDTKTMEGIEAGPSTSKIITGTVDTSPAIATPNITSATLDPSNNTNTGSANLVSAIPPRSSSTNQGTSEARCPVCNIKGHLFLECPTRLELSQLRAIRRGIQGMTGESKTKGLEEVAKQERLYQEAGYDINDTKANIPRTVVPAAPPNRSADAFVSVNNNPITALSSLHDRPKPVQIAPAPPRQSNNIQKRPGSQAESEQVKRQKIAPRPSAQPQPQPRSQVQAAQVQLPSSPNPHLSCVVCGKGHSVRSCPLVLGNTENLRIALSKVHPAHPRHSSMVALYKEKVQQDTKQKEAALLVAGRGQVDLMSSMKIARERREKQELEAAQAKAKVQSSGITCAFCSQMCGRDLKSCAEANGGRKALKTLIRSLETPGPEPPGQALDARLDLLYTCYTAWPKA